MLVTHSDTSPVFIECPDRRASPRIDHRESVEIDGREVRGLDISSTGIAVVASNAVSVGTTVRVRLAAFSDNAHSVISRARVARLEHGHDGIIVGLEFVD